MQNWEIALNKFLKSWRNKKEVVGALVCGSFVVGNPTKHSDIDLHIVLKDGTKWRERGNKIVDGFLIEYFVNPPEQIIQYFKEDYEEKVQMAVIQFLTGKILFDDGTINKLKQEAKKWYGKKFSKQSRVVQELNKYAIWDMLDNLQDAYEEEAPHFWFIYHNMLNKLIQQYCKFVRYPIIKEHKALEIFTEKKVRDKYLLPVFPDKLFQDMIKKALIENDKKQALKLYERLTNHVLEKMSGFGVDGWKVRSPVSY
ncbi:MAG: hypothetical protein KatS3mg088_061 [Patescibacteria group bacterium]|nr:MAG: hypothetical protein KatS3mg088_061 [Patescibacteria group bacterium]